MALISRPPLHNSPCFYCYRFANVLKMVKEKTLCVVCWGKMARVSSPGWIFSVMLLQKRERTTTPLSYTRRIHLGSSGSLQNPRRYTKRALKGRSTNSAFDGCRINPRTMKEPVCYSQVAAKQETYIVLPCPNLETSTECTATGNEGILQ